MKTKLFLLLAFVFVLGTACAVRAAEPSGGKIYLYGETHSVEAIMDKELELWQEHYSNGMRHLFVEQSYAGAQFLNLWMQTEDDTILDELFEDLKGTQAYSPLWKPFYKTIKETCPETIFHGTDVAHQHATTGKRYEQYLKDHDLTETAAFKQAVKNNQQGRQYDRRGGDALDIFRETALTENFIREFDALNGEDVMGIYGAYHTPAENAKVMAGKLFERYGDKLTSEDLSKLILLTEPLRADEITVNGREYSAGYFGRIDVGIDGYEYREVWQLKDAYEDFKDKPKTGNVLPFDNNYPMVMEEGQVYVVDYMMTNGKTQREYHRSDGGTYNGLPCTEEFRVE